MRSLYFSIGLNHPIAIWPGEDSASNRNEYQESFGRYSATGAYG
jgi:hypothetical protein